MVVGGRHCLVFCLQAVLKLLASLYIENSSFDISCI